MIKVKFDADDVKRKLRKAAENAANESMDCMAAELERMFESVRQSHGGQTVEEVLPALRAACRSSDFHPTDEQLSSYASAISENKSIAVKTEHIQL